MLSYTCLLRINVTVLVQKSVLRCAYLLNIGYRLILEVGRELRL